LCHEGVEEADRIVRADVVVEDFGKEYGLRAIGTGDVGHGSSSALREHWPNEGTHNIWNGKEFSHRLWPG
jgi:hypothetical protein